MAQGKKSAVIYCDLITTVEKMKDVDAGKLFKHFLRYINDQNPEAPNQIVEIVFEPIKHQLKRDLKKWEKKSDKNSETAKARWEKIRKDANALERKKNDAKNAVNVNDTVTDTVTVNDNVTGITKSDLIEIFFNDLENSTHFERICRNLSVNKQTLSGFIPEFRKKAELTYPTFDRFCSHFKNFVNNELNGKSKSGNNDRQERISSVNNMEDLAEKMLRGS